MPCVLVLVTGATAIAAVMTLIESRYLGCGAVGCIVTGDALRYLGRSTSGGLAHAIAPMSAAF